MVCRGGVDGDGADCRLDVAWRGVSPGLGWWGEAWAVGMGRCGESAGCGREWLGEVRRYGREGQVGQARTGPTWRGMACRSGGGRPGLARRRGVAVERYVGSGSGWCVGPDWLGPARRAGMDRKVGLDWTGLSAWVGRESRRGWGWCVGEVGLGEERSVGPDRDVEERTVGVGRADWAGEVDQVRTGVECRAGPKWSGLVCRPGEARRGVECRQGQDWAGLACRSESARMGQARRCGMA